VASEVTMLNGLGLPFFPDNVNNPPSWTASCEFWLSVPFAFLVSQSTPPAILLFFSLTCQMYLYNTVGSLSTLGGIVGMVRCMSSFLLGAATYPLFRQLAPWWSERLGPFSCTLLESTLVILVMSFFGEARAYASDHDFVGPWLFALVVLCFALEGGVLSLWLGKLDILGLISYSIYLDHRVVLAILWPTSPYMVSNFAASIVATSQVRATCIFWLLLLPTAWITYHYIEEPALKLLRKLVDRWLPGNPYAAWEGQYLNRGKIVKDKFYSIHGSMGRLTFKAPKVARMEYQGTTCRGELREGGNVHWSDGDVWMRARAETKGPLAWCGDPKTLVRV